MWLLPWRREGKKNKSGGSPSPKRKGGGPGTGGSQSAPASPRLSHHKTFGVHIDQAPKAPGSKVSASFHNALINVFNHYIDTLGS